MEKVVGSKVAKGIKKLAPGRAQSPARKPPASGAGSRASSSSVSSAGSSSNIGPARPFGGSDASYMGRFVFSAIHLRGSVSLVASQALDKDIMNEAKGLVRNVLSGVRQGVMKDSSNQRVVVPCAIGDVNVLCAADYFVTVVTKGGYPRRVAFHFLDTLRADLLELNQAANNRRSFPARLPGFSGGAEGKQKKIQRHLTRLTKKYEDITEVDVLYKTIRQVQEVKVLAYTAIENAVKNSEAFEPLAEKAEGLSRSAEVFKKSGTQLGRGFKGELAGKADGFPVCNITVGIIVAATIILLVAIVGAVLIVKQKVNVWLVVGVGAALAVVLIAAAYTGMYALSKWEIFGKTKKKIKEIQNLAVKADKVNNVYKKLSGDPSQPSGGPSNQV